LVTVPVILEKKPCSSASGSPKLQKHNEKYQTRERRMIGSLNPSTYALSEWLKKSTKLRAKTVRNCIMNAVKKVKGTLKVKE
jgi:hypothetical protein